MKKVSILLWVLIIAIIILPQSVTTRSVIKIKKDNLFISETLLNYKFIIDSIKMKLDSSTYNLLKEEQKLRYQNENLQQHYYLTNNK